MEGTKLERYKMKGSVGHPSFMDKKTKLYFPPWQRLLLKILKTKTKKLFIGKLAKMMGVNPTMTSYHLKNLELMGLIETRYKRGTRRYIMLSDTGFTIAKALFVAINSVNTMENTFVKEVDDLYSFIKKDMGIEVEDGDKKNSKE